MQWRAEEDYKRIILRINTNKADFTKNPDNGVSYKLTLLPVGQMPSDPEPTKDPSTAVHEVKVMKDVEFKVFREAAQLIDGRVVELCVPGGTTLSRKEIDDYTEFVKTYGARGLAYIKLETAAQKGAGPGLSSPILKYLKPEVTDEIIRRTGAVGGLLESRLE